MNTQPIGGGTGALDLSVLPDTCAVCPLAAGAPSPAWLEAKPFAAVTRTPDETSVVCWSAAVPVGVRAEHGWRAIRVAGPLDFAHTGAGRRVGLAASGAR